MWRVCFFVLVLCTVNYAAPPVLPTEQKVAIVEPQKPSDELVSIVEASYPEALAREVETTSEDNPTKVVDEGELIEPLVTMIDHKQPLPDTSLITGELTEKLGVTNFFALWLVFNDPHEFDLQRGTEFTILAPRASPPVNSDEAAPTIVRKLLLDHVILGRRLRLANRKDLQPFTVTTLGGRNLHFTHTDGSWSANGAKVLEAETEVPPSGEVIVLESYLFSDYNVTTTDEVKQPQESVTVASSLTATTEENSSANLADELGKLPEMLNQTRLPVFNKYLKESNVSQWLEAGEQYTVLFPTDRAFQKWHPIDWGFYPFSVPEFTADIVRSHFLKGVYKYDEIQDNQTATTITGKTVTFRKALTGELTVNGVSVMRRNVALRGGTVFVIPDVLFVTHRIVQELRKHNKDKETPPLVAYPWWNAQFLSHAYLALETNPKFTSMQRLMNSVQNLHLRVPGKNYSFFVPTDEAFERVNMEVPAWLGDRSATELVNTETVAAIEEFILRHLVPGRLYQRELQSGMELKALDNSTHTLSKLENGMFAVDKTSLIEEGDVFVYNLGTMFFVDGVLGLDEQVSKLKDILAQQKTPPTPATSELGEEETEGVSRKDILLEDTTELSQTNVTQALKPVETTESEKKDEVSVSKTPEVVPEESQTKTEAQSDISSSTTVRTAVSVAVESKNTESNDIPAAEP